MNELMKICEIFFDSKSLRVNAKKCTSLLTLPVKGKNSMKVVSAPHRWWKEVPMPSMSFDSLSKYLGVMIDPDGGMILPMEKWTNWIEKLERSPLRPAQKIRGLESVIIPRMIYQLRLSDAGIGKLRKVSRMVKKTIKRILHLPKWTPNCWLHLKAGGDLTNLVSAVIKMRRKASGKIVNSEEPIAQAIAVELDLTNTELYQRANLPVSTHGANAKIDTENLTCLSRLTNGTALLTMAGSRARREWLWHAKSFSSRCLLDYLSEDPLRNSSD